MLRDIDPVRSGVISRDGASITFQVFGEGERTILLLPTWSIVHTDFWRHQVRDFRERYTVVTFDGFGNGASDRPTDPSYYSDDNFTTDAVSVMDAAGFERATVMSASMGAAWQLLLADRHPTRVEACVFIATDLPLAPLPPPPEYAQAELSFAEVLENHEGWMMWNREFWHRDWESFCRFFFAQCFTEPDSGDEIEHFLSMGLETSPDVIAATIDAEGISEDETVRAASSLVPPALVIHGDGDAISSVVAGRELARLSGAEMVELPGSGHEPQCRIARHVNALIEEFLARHLPSAT